MEKKYQWAIRLDKAESSWLGVEDNGRYVSEIFFTNGFRYVRSLDEARLFATAADAAAAFANREVLFGSTDKFSLVPVRVTEVTETITRVVGTKRSLT